MMNWMQLYEILACGLLALCCVSFNLSMRLPKLTKMMVALLGVSALIRCGGLTAKYIGVLSVSQPIVAAADGNIALLTAVALTSIVVHQLRARNQEAVK